MARNFDSDFYNDELDEWRKSFLCLEDDNFLKIMRIYLSEVKTPFNKQKLLEQLEGFLRREETQKNIASLLSKQDVLILSAIKFIPNASIESLRKFFGSAYSEERLSSHLQELKARLLIYETSSSRRFGSTYKITPIFNEPLKNILQAKNLFPAYSPEQEKNARGKKTGTPSHNDCITIEFVAAFLSYIAKNKGICKIDGTFKKRAEEELNEKFPEQIKRLSLLTRALANLALVTEVEGGFELNWSQLEAFAELKNSEQLLYLLAAIPAHSSKERIRMFAEFFLNALNAIPQSGCKDSVFLSYMNLLASKDSFEYYSYSRPSRFSKMVQSHNSSAEDVQSEPTTLDEFFMRMLDNAEFLGITATMPVFKEKSSEDLLYKVIFKNQEFLKQNPEPSEAMLKIDSAFNITLMQGFGLNKILPLIKFADLVKFDTAPQFEITKESVIRALDLEMDSEKIISFLKENSRFDLPESLAISIKEWEEAYKSISIYKGFVIRLDEKSAPLAEHNSSLKQHIFAQLAPGIFLLDCDDEAKVERLLKKCGIENTGKIKTAQKETHAPYFSSLGDPRTLFEGNDDEQNSASPKERKSPEEALQDIYKKIDALEIADGQKDALREIASSKMLVSSSQLRPPSLATEKKSARGMDYQGKVHIIEQALRNKEKILFKLSKDTPLEIGTPISIDRTKFADGIYLNLFVGNEQKEYSVGRIEFVQRLHRRIV